MNFHKNNFQGVSHLFLSSPLPKKMRLKFDQFDIRWKDAVTKMIFLTGQFIHLCIN